MQRTNAYHKFNLPNIITIIVLLIAPTIVKNMPVPLATVGWMLNYTKVGLKIRAAPTPNPAEIKPPKSPIKARMQIDLHVISNSP